MKKLSTDGSFTLSVSEPPTPTELFSSHSLGGSICSYLYEGFMELVPRKIEKDYYAQSCDSSHIADLNKNGEFRKSFDL